MRFKCPGCEKELEFEIKKTTKEENTDKKKLRGRWFWICQFIFMFFSIGISYVVIFWIVSNMQNLEWESCKYVAGFLFFGVSLNFIRSLIKDMNNWHYKRMDDIREKHLGDIWPSFILNYPVFLVAAFFLMGVFRGNFLVIPFIVGWSVDYLWKEGNLFSGLKEIIGK